MEAQKPKLLDQVRDAIRTRRYSRRTEDAYVHWIRRFIIFHGTRHPRELGEAEVAAFISKLANRGVSASTQNQALSAILFLYEVVFGRRLAWMIDVVRAQRPVRLPVVLSREEVARLLGHLHGPVWLMGSLMYGAGLRLLECAELRVKDLHLVRAELTVRDGKGGKDRVTLLPAALTPRLAEHLAHVKAQHDADLAAGRGAVALPGALREVSQRATRVGVAMGVSRDAFLCRGGAPGTPPASSPRIGRAAGGQSCREGCRHSAASNVPLAAALVRDAPARSRLRHPDDLGAARPPRREHDDDLYARAQPG